MAAKIKELYQQNETVTHVAVAPSGGWLLIRGDYGFWQAEVPKAMADALWTINAAKTKISCVAFGPDDGWLVIFNPVRNLQLVSAPTSTPSPTPVPAPTAAQASVSATWPDGRILGHRDHSVSTYVVNVKTGDTLKLRSGPGTMSSILAEIPAGGTGISAFDQDRIWDGDTWWYPIEWNGFRGYVGRRFLAGF